MKPLILTLGLLAALPAEAGSFTPPEGCETFLTVQARGCRVSNHYRCEADAPVISGAPISIRKVSSSSAM